MIENNILLKKYFLFLRVMSKGLTTTHRMDKNHTILKNY
ncbi:hypothetical protein AUTU_01280 [Aureibacter tunicatorum]|nr:hypothetical protein AUTU_01280 [Aureibacter tunicatorum]